MRRPGLTSSEVDTAAERPFGEGSVARRAFAATFDRLPSAVKTEVELAASLDLLPALLDLLGELTGMGFTAVVHVTEKHWVACAVRDTIQFGLQVGGELAVETTVCSEVRNAALPIVIENVTASATWSTHPCASTHPFTSYLSMPIVLPDGTFFGTVCATHSDAVPTLQCDVLLAAGAFADAIGVHVYCLRELARPETSQALSHFAGELDGPDAPDGGAATNLVAQLRAPLHAIRVDGSRLQRAQLIRADHTIREMTLRLLARDITQLRVQCANLFDLARLHDGEPLLMQTIERQPLRELMRRAVDRLRVAYPDRMPVVELDAIAGAEHDAQRLEQALTTVLLAALRSSSPQRPIEVHARQRNDRFLVHVLGRDTLLDSDEIATLHQPGWRPPAAQGDAELLLGNGLGLGLHVPGQIVRAHGGSLQARRNGDDLLIELALPMPVEVQDGHHLFHPVNIA